MKIIDRLREDKIHISFEVFPPKTDEGFDKVAAATDEIAKLNPAFISVTYGAGGGTSKNIIRSGRRGIILYFPVQPVCQSLVTFQSIQSVLPAPAPTPAFGSTVQKTIRFRELSIVVISIEIHQKPDLAHI